MKTKDKADECIDILTEVGISGDEAGKRMRGFIAKCARIKIGFSTGPFDIEEALKELHKETERLSAEQREKLLFRYFGAEDMTAANLFLQHNPFVKNKKGTPIAMQIVKGGAPSSQTAEDNVFDNRTPEVHTEETGKTERRYSLFEKHHGSFVVRNNNTDGLYVKQETDHVAKKSVFKDVELKDASRWHYRHVDSVISMLMEFNNQKESGSFEFGMLVIKRVGKGKKAKLIYSVK